MEGRIHRQNKEKGQILIFSVYVLLVLCFFSILVFNLGRIIYWRIKVQNVCDNIAQSVGCIRARALNVIGLLNLPLGLILTVPRFVWWPQYQCNSMPIEYHVDGDFAKLAQQTVESIVSFQELVRIYGEWYPYIAAYRMCKENQIDNVLFLDSLSLHLKRDKGDIWYWKTCNIGIHFPPYINIHVPAPEPFDIIKKQNTERWYKRNDKEFGKQSVRVLVYKKLKGLFGKKFFKLRDDPVVYSISEVRCYNKSGPMFPPEEGLKDWIEFKFRREKYNIIKWDIKFGGETGLSAVCEYLFALPGWEAQLVPYNIKAKKK